MRQQPEFFEEDAELVLVYIAKKLKEAVRLEEIFSEAGLHYLVEPDTYSGGMIFKSERVGAFFYVAAEDESRGKKVLEGKGYQPYEAEPS